MILLYLGTFLLAIFSGIEVHCLALAMLMLSSN